ncbi:protein root UVB sensitive 4 [Tripterygium wilfordii]|uniref:protein root UVB sensitive 4 n=1 Tax=Tripterygium wilfordii TaxID=458696 RepID=UPI0018F86074|nr:protein root UVB sensitive 4 [Tripterygium wilfordii]
MQSFLYAPSNSHYFPLQWQSREIKLINLNSVFKKPNKFSPKTLAFTNSLRTSIGSNPEEGLDQGHLPGEDAARLPVVIRRSGRVSRYVWDGSCLRLLGVDGGAGSFSIDFNDGFRQLFRDASLGIRNFFIPKQVPDNYMGYVKWKLLHRVFSSASQVLATQAMFQAIGIGYSQSLPSAAALNWVLKDGLGRLCRCVYTASLASAFDTNLKRVRFATSVLFSLSIGLELLTPAIPKYFLLLASVANIAKQISLACYLATASAVHRSFAIADNLGEVSAKAQIQSVCFDNLGLMLAALLNMLFKSNQRLLAGLPFILYPIFSAVDLFGIYQGLKHVHLQTLTKDRLEIILNTWIDLRYVPSPAEVSKKDGINLLSKGMEFCPIRIGFLNTESQIPKLSMMAMHALTGKDYYFICMEKFCSGFSRTTLHGLLLCVREGAETADVIMGLLQACYIRKVLLLNQNRWGINLEVSDYSDSDLKEWIKLVDDSKQYSEADMHLLTDEMEGMGWAIKNILLSMGEQARYSYVDN